MPKQEQTSCPPARIAELDPTFREIDGVVFDAESYQRHCCTPAVHVRNTRGGPPVMSPIPQPAEQPAPIASPTLPQGVFRTEPIHLGWYETTDTVSYPVMGGAPYPCGSGSGSWLSSYLTSYLSSFGSWRTSFLWGSWISSAGSSALCGGYGLDLI